MIFGAEFFVAIAFVLFVIGLGYLGVQRQIARALDSRIARVENELADAARLRAEAQAILASFEKKRVAAEAEAKAIVAAAKLEAETLAQETAARMADFIARRTKQAEGKIAQAEAQAAADVRAAAADAAVRAAEIVLKDRSKGEAAAGFVEKGIAELSRLLH